MTSGEFQHNGKTITFAIDPLHPPPATVSIRLKTCCKSAVTQVELQYVTTDTRRDIAVYRVERQVAVGGP